MVEFTTLLPPSVLHVARDLEIGRGREGRAASRSSNIFTEASDFRVVMRNCRDCWGGFFHYLVSHVSVFSEVHVSSSRSEDHTNIGWEAL